MNIKMIVTDLDGTLLDDNKNVTAYTFGVFDKCRKAGIKVIYATARGHSAYEKVPLDKVDGHVRDNGARAYVGNNLCYKRLIHIDYIRDFITNANKHGYNIILKSDATHYANFNSDDSKFIYTDVAKLDIEMEEFYMPSISTEGLDYFKAHLPTGLNTYLGRDNWFMITHAEAVKPLAIAAVADYWGISAENIVAFGDDVNDVAMIEYAGAGVAMGNAINEVKAVADYVCGDNNSDGVAKWIEENVLRLL